ncbi:MAG: MarR family transcriptional regulator [Myxococcota bacterium]
MSRTQQRKGGLTTLERVERLFQQMRALSSLQPDAFSDLDLTLTQLKVLGLLKVRQPMTVTAVAQTLKVTLPTASARVDRLVREGLVVRKENPEDRRQLQLRLSDRGENLLGGLERRSDAEFRRALERMTPAGLRAMEVALKDLLMAIALLAAEARGNGTSAPVDAPVRTKARPRAARRSVRG